MKKVRVPRYCQHCRAQEEYLYGEILNEVGKLHTQACQAAGCEHPPHWRFSRDDVMKVRWQGVWEILAEQTLARGDHHSLKRCLLNAQEGYLAATRIEISIHKRINPSLELDPPYPDECISWLEILGVLLEAGKDELSKLTEWDADSGEPCPVPWYLKARGFCV
jgi:hypothetical protein